MFKCKNMRKVKNKQKSFSRIFIISHYFALKKLSDLCG